MLKKSELSNIRGRENIFVMMWPMLLDTTEEESIQSLRHLELEAYSSLVSALRAQGALNQDKRRVLKDTSILLNISSERHKAEVRRAISDEKLNTIAYHIAGRLNSFEDWAQEGRRLVPLLPRTPPQTLYSVIADDASEAATQCNKQLPYPANTERKRPTPQSVGHTIGSTETSAKPVPFKIPEAPKDESKKRNLGESNSLAQHLLSPKLTKIQQIYRQGSMTPKQKGKETLEVENSDLNKSTTTNVTQVQQLVTPNVNISKINIIQNIRIPCANEGLPTIEEEKEKTVNSLLVNENQAPVSKALGAKPDNNLSLSQSTIAYGNNEAEQTIDPTKLCITKKTINKGQKLIVVSNAQSLPTNSILHSLSVPITTLSKLKMDKFKIVPNGQLPSTLPVSNTVPNQKIVTSKPKLVTIKNNCGKKVIPLSQLQMLNSKGNLKVVPYGGKVEKHNYLPKTQGKNKYKRAVPPITQSLSVYNNDLQTDKSRNEMHKLENGGKPIENFEFEMTELEISEVNCNELELDDGEADSSENSEMDDQNSDGDSNDGLAMELDSFEVLQAQQDNELLGDFEVIHTEGILQ